MAPTQHSPWPASSAKRNIECPAAYQTSLPFSGGPRTSSVYAAEGTLAHGLAEDFLSGTLASLEDAIGTTREADGFAFVVDQDMVDHVRLYTDRVQGLEMLGFAIQLEVRVSPEWLWETTKQTPPVLLFGTSDCVAYKADTRELEIVDLKYGRGIAVDAEDNAQLLYYALGAAMHHGMRVDTVRTTIVQPRAPHPEGPVRSVAYTMRGVLDWGFNTLRPAVEMSVSWALDKLTYKTGEHCKYCPAMLVCPEIERTRKDAALRAFDQLDHVEALGPKLAGYLDDADVLEEWIARVRLEAYERVQNGGSIPGWKLVSKRATRVWSNPDAAAARIVEDLGDEHAACFEAPELKSPAKIEKLPAVKARPDLLSALRGYVSAVSSGTTLARDSDPRPAVQGRADAGSVFDDL